MKRESLLDFFEDRIRSANDFLLYDDGYRVYTHSYDQVRSASRGFGSRLRQAGVEPGQRVVIWGENRPEWIVALWGCLLARAVVVPVDYRASAALLRRVVTIVNAPVVIHGDEVSLPSLPDPVTLWSLDGLWSAPGEASHDVDEPGPTRPEGMTEPELAEIIFTSGATAEPKGVKLTHQNILANVVPVEREILRYRRYAKPFAPIRFLDLLPLSHMFGQAMGTFVPPMLAGVTVFMRGYNPADIVRQIRTRRVSVLVCVPKILEVLRDHIVRLVPEALEAPPHPEHVAWRWWRYRRVHRLLGPKFWSFVVGAAPLDPDLEAFWSRLGFLVVQGYGLTETAPIVTLNHPFRARRGTVGTPIGGVEVKIAPDGEILVRGDNVTSGYFDAPEATAAAFADGWFHTGDVGTLDESGRLAVRGRKKDIIVTPDGLNVFPEDVERVLIDLPGVQDAAVVGATDHGDERVHAILVLTAGTAGDRVLRDANERLEAHQRIKGYSIWPDATLPRTEGTQKLKRQALRRWVAEGVSHPPVTPARPPGLVGVVQRLAPNRQVDPSTTLEELGLSSLERIELMMAVEQAFDQTVDERAFADARTVADLEALVRSNPPVESETGRIPGPTSRRADPADEFPTWTQSRLARVVRRLSLSGFLLPLTRLFAWTTVDGRERVAAVDGPVVFAANHQSHLDGPVILAALPPKHRYRLATAAGKEFFAAHFHSERFSRRQWLSNSLNYYLSALLFNVFPLPQREAGARDAIRYLGELLGAGTSVLIFPEGRRTEDGAIQPFQPGIGMIAARLRVPVVPIRIEGLDRILHQRWRMARPGRARVAFGDPLHLTGDDYPALAKRVEEAIRGLEPTAGRVAAR